MKSWNQMGSAFSTFTHVAVCALPDKYVCLVEVLLIPQGVGICPRFTPQIWQN